MPPRSGSGSASPSNNSGNSRKQTPRLQDNHFRQPVTRKQSQAQLQPKSKTRSQPASQSPEDLPSPPIPQHSSYRVRSARSKELQLQLQERPGAEPQGDCVSSPVDFKQSLFADDSTASALWGLQNEGSQQAPSSPSRSKDLFLSSPFQASTFSGVGGGRSDLIKPCPGDSDELWSPKQTSTSTDPLTSEHHETLEFLLAIFPMFTLSQISETYQRHKLDIVSTVEELLRINDFDLASSAPDDEASGSVEGDPPCIEGPAVKQDVQARGPSLEKSSASRPTGLDDAALEYVLDTEPLELLVDARAQQLQEMFPDQSVANIEAALAVYRTVDATAEYLLEQGDSDDHSRSPSSQTAGSTKTGSRPSRQPRASQEETPAQVRTVRNDASKTVTKIKSARKPDQPLKGQAPQGSLSFENLVRTVQEIFPDVPDQQILDAVVECGNNVDMITDVIMAGGFARQRSGTGIDKLDRLVELFPGRSVEELRRALIDTGSVEGVFEYFEQLDRIRRDPAWTCSRNLGVDTELGRSEDADGVVMRVAGKGSSVSGRVKYDGDDIDQARILKLAGETSQTGMPDSKELRGLAQLYHERRSELYRRAVDAYQRGKSTQAGTARYYADEGQKATLKMQELNRQAAHAIIRENKLKHNDDNIVDLHGLTVAEAKEYIDRELDRWRRNKASSRKPLTIICGQGNHSKGSVGRLDKLIFEYLKQQGWSLQRERAGAFVVRPEK
ncbi:uncharacterized protein BJ171DRAFT_107856 [Polychytrium aggregatum]|uniref:uncharacterized protein n=1 Tax=Polychytrium aggregatum TaxID=110093 RepID=UPI0022FEC284|nr:uncharacterized protein BJ171DRAFT_107856 [Polychytrium aggregatum]KAI9204528.1 hypothetical protein BJ171DRAFT_107856 [Polychytrium aggregatum]